MAVRVRLAAGVIYYITESGSCMEVLQADGSIRFLLYYDAKEELVVVTDTMVLGEFQVEYDGTLSEITKVSAAGRGAAGGGYRGTGDTAWV